MSGLQEEEGGLRTTPPTTKGTTFVIYADSGFTKTKSLSTTSAEEVALRRLLLTRMITLDQRTDCATIKRDQAPLRR
jgi:hypothetical protein